MNLFNPPMTAALQTNVDVPYMGWVLSVLTMMGSVMMLIKATHYMGCQ